MVWRCLGVSRLGFHFLGGLRAKVYPRSKNKMFRRALLVIENSELFLLQSTIFYDFLASVQFAALDNDFVALIAAEEQV